MDIHSLLLKRLHAYEQMGRAALIQLTDEDVSWSPDPESNSIAIIVKHIAGNARSRFTDFLTSDGEKPDRHRDSEFEAAPTTAHEVLEMWDEGWKYVFDALDPLSDRDHARTITIRGEAHTVVDAILRQIAHYASHIGQIVYIAKHRRGAAWKTLSIARGMSDNYVPPAVAAATPN